MAENILPKPRFQHSILYVKILRWAVVATLVIAPFYATLAIWLASSLHHLDFFKIWKEIALTAMSLVIISFLATHRSFAKKMFSSRLMVLIVLYSFFLLAIGIYDLLTHRVARPAVIYGWLIDIRPVGFFLVAYLTFAISARKKTSSLNWKKVILIPAFLVLVFGFLQMTVLPKDVLRHVGYSKTTTAPYETVDNQPNIVRVQSTTRGPNPLGAYLVIIITLLTVLMLSEKRRNRLWTGLLLALSLVVLFGTYSRSAEVGIVLSWVVLLSFYQRQFLRKHIYIVAAAIALVILAGLVAATQKNYLAQNIFFHSSNRSSSSVSSNAQRSSAIKTATSDVVHHPLGGGIGSAGPASRRNSKKPAKIAENYYLQIGQEAGVLGLVLFIAINILVAKELWLRRQSQLAKVLLASLVGLTFVNLVSHAWTDDTLAYIWWGLAGIALAPAILTDRKHKQHEKAQQTAP